MADQSALGKSCKNVVHVGVIEDVMVGIVPDLARLSGDIKRAKKGLAVASEFP